MSFEMKLIATILGCIFFILALLDEEEGDDDKFPSRELVYV